MKAKAVFIFTVSAALGLSFIALSQGAEPAPEPDSVKRIVKQNCSVSGCHAGKYPAAGLSLEPDKFPASVVGVPSQEKPGSLIVDAAAPDKSYLLAKIKGDPGIVGGRMPFKRDPLPEEDIRLVEEWIKSLAAPRPGATAPAGLNIPAPHGPASASSPDTAEDAAQAANPKVLSKPPFWGTTLVDLPTTTTLSRGEFLFRISHRFEPPMSSGWDSFYGLDGPAYIFFSFGYGITDRLMVSLGRSRLYQEWDLRADWAIAEQRKNTSLPFSATLHAGGSLVSQDEPQGAEWSGRFRFNALLSLSHQLNDRFSFLLVPACSSNTNYWETDSDGTFALGIGGRFMVIDDLSLIAEWVPVLAGYEEEYSGWGFGVEKKIGGHVFQVFVTDSIGIISSQYLPGGDLRLGDGDFRIGFNIFRSF